ncbi:MAG: YsnF/AvaK domain-containing protein [Sphingomonas sp.]|nr:YsnF/AvaK domain-containing protein [Sphingomonas sp.]
MADQTSLSKDRRGADFPASDNSSEPRGDFESTPEEYAAIPLVEERLSVGKREVETGRVRVRVTVEEREETITEQLARDDVQIERVPRNERLTEMPHVRLEGSTTIIPVVEEVLVTEKVLVLVEEIHVRRRTEMETVQIPTTVRSERATVERDTTPRTREE